jgi:hypothetical protein
MAMAYSFRLAAAASLLAAAAPAAHAAEMSGYGFPSAAQEITQLYWLAETADVCGWSSAQDVVKFKRFAVRFLGAHLPDRHREALASMVGGRSYAERVRQAAEEGAVENCRSNRWRLGWASYKTAADQNDTVY